MKASEKADVGGCGVADDTSPSSFPGIRSMARAKNGQVPCYPLCYPLGLIWQT
jgi:hypothetical protein